MMVVRRGQWSVFAACHRDTCPVMDGLEFTGGPGDVDRRKMLRRIAATASSGPPRNTEQGRPLRDGVYELKSQGGLLRLFYFRDEGRVIVCSHVAVKPKRKQLEAEIDKVIRLREEYREAKAVGFLEIVEEL